MGGEGHKSITKVTDSLRSGTVKTWQLRAGGKTLLAQSSILFHQYHPVLSTCLTLNLSTYLKLIFSRFLCSPYEIWCDCLNQGFFNRRQEFRDNFRGAYKPKMICFKNGVLGICSFSSGRKYHCLIRISKGIPINS